MSWTSRWWETSASSAPSVTTMDTPVCWASSTICSQKVRQRKFGSGPSTSRTSLPGVDAAHTATCGHTISLVAPSASRTYGRTVEKSVNSSGSMLARTRPSHPSMSERTAVDAASAASFQPVNPTIMTGRRSGTSLCQLTYSTIETLQRRRNGAPCAGRPNRRCLGACGGRAHARRAAAARSWGPLAK